MGHLEDGDVIPLGDSRLVLNASQGRSGTLLYWYGTNGPGGQPPRTGIFGGFLMVHYWWGSVFLINVPIAAAALIAAVFLVPDSRNQASRPDVTGALLSIGRVRLAAVRYHRGA